MPFCVYCGRAQPSTFSKTKPVRLPIICTACGQACGDIIAPIVGDIKREILRCPHCGQSLQLSSRQENGGYSVDIERVETKPDSYSPW